jgi:hypothetical protein
MLAVNLIQETADGMANKLQMIHAIEQLRKNPQRAKELYSLYAGDSFNDEEIPEGVIDTARIEQISVRNRFGSENIKPTNMKNQNYKNIYIDSCHLYILPSYFNHSCLGNI